MLIISVLLHRIMPEAAIVENELENEDLSKKLMFSFISKHVCRDSQKCGLGGQGWRLRGGGRRMTGFPRISSAGVNRDKGRTPGFPPSSPFWVLEFLKLFSQET